MVAIKQGLTDSHSFVSPLACAEDNVPQRLFFSRSDGASTRRPRSSQVSGTPQRWLCHEVSVFLIHSETRLRKAAKPHIRTFGGFFFLFSYFSSSSVLSSSLSRDGLIFLPSAGSLPLLLLMLNAAVASANPSLSVYCGQARGFALQSPAKLVNSAGLSCRDLAVPLLVSL